MLNVKSDVLIPGVPLYRQVRDGIESMIPNHPHPSEIELSDAALGELFGVSRITVRRAIDELVKVGILYRIQGTGTFVRPEKLSEKLTLHSFLETWTHTDEQLEIRVGALERIAADAALAADFDVPMGHKFVYVRRLRSRGKVLVAVDDRYIRAECCPRLRRQDVVTLSIADYLRNQAAIALSHGEMDVEARNADRWDAELLEIKRGAPVLVRRITLFAKTGKAIVKGTSVYRADCVKHHFAVSA